MIGYQRKKKSGTAQDPLRSRARRGFLWSSAYDAPLHEEKPSLRLIGEFDPKQLGRRASEVIAHPPHRNLPEVAMGN
jgi:hypothetical protein